MVVAEEIGRLIQKKKEGYGDSLNISAEVMKQLYPQGVMPGDYKVFGILYRMVDKMCRIANGFEEDSWMDLAGYSIRVEAQRRKLAANDLSVV
jgi:hypothetical protein